MIGTFAMPGSTVRCSLELYFQVSHYPLTQIHHHEDWHTRSSQGRSSDQDQPFWLTACSGGASRFPSRALYFNVSCLLALPSPSRHSGGCFLTVKLILKYLLLGFDFLHNGSKVLHAGESNRMPEQRPSILQSSLLRFLSKHAYRYPGELLEMNEQTAEPDLDNFEENRPARAKIDGDRVINTSSPLVPLIYSYTRSVLCDFSEARFGE